MTTDPKDLCPGCHEAGGVRLIDGAPGADAWTCNHCGLSWAVAPAQPQGRPHYLADLGSAAEEIWRLRWLVDQFLALAAAPELSDREVRDRLTRLADRARRRAH